MLPSDPCGLPTNTVADPGLMKGGFSVSHRILAMGVLTMEKGAVGCKACHLGGVWGNVPQENF